MNFKTVLTIFFICVAAFTFFSLDNWLQTKFLAVLEGDEYLITAEAWGILVKLWPVALAFGLFSIVLGGSLGLFLGDIAANKNIESTKLELEKSVSVAREQLEDEMRIAENLKNQAKEKMFEAKSAQHKAAEAIKKAEAMVSIHKNKKTRAMAFNERKKRKSDKLKSKIEQGENITLDDVEKILL